jgi:hypothetical protein
MIKFSPSNFSTIYSYKDLIGQLLISKQLSDIPSSWKLETSFNLNVGFEQRLDHLKVSIPEGNGELIIVGYVFDLDDSLESPWSAITDARQFFASVELRLRKLAGRYICIASFEDQARVYLDASGSLSLVYSPSQKICASTISCIPYSEFTQDRTELIETLDVTSNNVSFAFGLTPRHNISRLLPNHYLDLNTWAASRHWPVGDRSISATPEEDIKEISDILAKTISVACRAEHSIYMSLTAGFDSRALLATCKDNLDSIKFFTWHLPDKTAENDVKIARQLAKSHALDYQEFPFVEASEADRGLWLFRTGLSVGELRGISLSTTVNSMDSYRNYLPGLVSEFGRGAFWRGDDSEETVLDARNFLDRMRLPHTKEFIEAAHQWFINLPVKGVFEALDLLHLEQQLGCWAGVTAYGHAAGPKRFHPYSQGRILDLLFMLPPDFKRKNLVPIEIIRHRWPQLLELPINGRQFGSIKTDAIAKHTPEQGLSIAQRGLRKLKHILRRL